MFRPWTCALLLAGLAPRAAGIAATPCPALPSPAGNVVRVATTAELQAAVGSLQPGTTVLIADGTYDLVQTLVIDAADVALRGESGDRDRVVIRGRGMGNPSFGNVPHGVLVRARNLLLADLTIRDAWYHNVQIAGELGATGARLYNLHLVDSGEQQVKVSTAGPPGPYGDGGEVACSLIEYSDRARSDYTNGVDALAVSGWVVRDNMFRNIRAPLGQLAGPTVLFWRNSLGTVVERNRFIDCDRGIALGLSPPDANSRDGETTYDHQGGIIRNNAYYRAASSPTGDVGISVNYARDFRIVHNTVVQQGSFPWTIEYRFAASSGSVACNLSDGPVLARDGATATLAGNVTSAPLTWFADAAAADLHLAAAAAGAIDQASPQPDVADDLDAAPRPAGAAPDVGADERCLLPAAPVAALTAVKAGNDVRLAWDATAIAAANAWYVADKADIDDARLGGAPAQAVAGCTPPASATAGACSDRAAITRSSPTGIDHYQVRAFCAGSGEGP